MVIVGRTRVAPSAPDEVWGADFVSDQLADGMRFRALIVVDVNSRGGLAIEVGQQLGADYVVAALNRLATRRKAPSYLFVDNGSGLPSRLLDLWAYHHKGQIGFSRPGNATDNAFAERFNGSLRDECFKRRKPTLYMVRAGAPSGQRSFPI